MKTTHPKVPVIATTLMMIFLALAAISLGAVVYHGIFGDLASTLAALLATFACCACAIWFQRVDAMASAELAAETEKTKP